ncbi:hypothetical protein BABINDRAFT_118558, partial [Babjeviella inositovora NRRL Y-12698]
KRRLYRICSGCEFHSESRFSLLTKLCLQQCCCHTFVFIAENPVSACKYIYALTSPTRPSSSSRHNFTRRYHIHAHTIPHCRTTLIYTRATIFLTMPKETKQQATQINSIWFDEADAKHRPTPSSKWMPFRRLKISNTATSNKRSLNITVSSPFNFNHLAHVDTENMPNVANVFSERDIEHLGLRDHELLTSKEDKFSHSPPTPTKFRAYSSCVTPPVNSRNSSRSSKGSQMTVPESPVFSERDRLSTFTNATAMSYDSVSQQQYSKTPLSKSNSFQCSHKPKTASGDSIKSLMMLEQEQQRQSCDKYKSDLCYSSSSVAKDSEESFHFPGSSTVGEGWSSPPPEGFLRSSWYEETHIDPKAAIHTAKNSGCETPKRGELNASMLGTPLLPMYQSSTSQVTLLLQQRQVQQQLQPQKMRISQYFRMSQDDFMMEKLSEVLDQTFGSFDEAENTDDFFSVTPPEIKKDEQAPRSPTYDQFIETLRNEEDEMMDSEKTWNSIRASRNSTHSRQLASNAKKAASQSTLDKVDE